jgi:hypothetical protein
VRPQQAWFEIESITCCLKRSPVLGTTRLSSRLLLHSRRTGDLFGRMTRST